MPPGRSVARSGSRQRNLGTDVTFPDFYAKPLSARKQGTSRIRVTLASQEALARHHELAEPRAALPAEDRPRPPRFAPK